MEQADFEEKQKLIAQNPAYANMICRCESISEGEILDAIHRPVGATTVDGVKTQDKSRYGTLSGRFLFS